VLSLIVVDTRLRDSRRGFGLLVVIVLLAVVAMVGAAVSSRTRSLLNTGQAESLQARANDTAYSGLQSAVASIERGQDDWNALGARTALPTHGELAFELKVTDNLNNDQPLQDSDGTDIPPESLYVKSLAYVNNELKAGASCVIAQERGATFNYPAFGSSSVSLDNSLVEAVDGSGNTVGGDGHVRTNGTQSDAVTLEGGSYVDGDVTVGAGGDPVIAMNVESGSGFAGDSQIAGADLPLPDVAASYSDTAPDVEFFNIPIPIPGIFTGIRFLNILGIGVATPGSYNEMIVEPTSNMVLQPSIAGNSETMINVLILAEGDYYVNELGSTGMAGVFIPAGEVRIHVRDGVTMGAGATSINVESARAFQVYGTEDAGQVTMTAVSGKMVMAAKGDMAVTASVIEGALYGKTVDITDSSLRYPKELDGMALNDKVRGNWNQFGLRLLAPDEIEIYNSP
jgi:type II secretory pathway pseudopilin PulG